MKTPTLKVSDDQIEAEVAATRLDPSAWERLAFVPASSSRRPAWMLRGKHLAPDADPRGPGEPGEIG